MADKAKTQGDEDGCTNPVCIFVKTRPLPGAPKGIWFPVYWCCDDGSCPPPPLPKYGVPGDVLTVPCNTHTVKVGVSVCNPPGTCVWTVENGQWHTNTVCPDSTCNCGNANTFPPPTPGSNYQSGCRKTRLARKKAASKAGSKP